MSALFVGFVKGAVYCDDEQECASQTALTDSSIVACRGYFACAFSKIDSGGYTDCEGSFACYFSVIDSAGYSLCRGYFGCAYSEIAQAGSYLYGLGYYSMYGTAAVGNGASYLYGFASYCCMFSYYTGFSNAYLYGFFGGAYSTLDTVTTPHDRATYVYLYGYYSGYMTAVFCRSGNTCYIYCRDNGCYMADVIAYSGSSVSVSCDDSCRTCPDQISVAAGSAEEKQYLAKRENMMDEAKAKEEEKGMVKKVNMKSKKGSKKKSDMSQVYGFGSIVFGLLMGIGVTKYLGVFKESKEEC